MVPDTAPRDRSRCARGLAYSRRDILAQDARPVPCGTLGIRRSAAIHGRDCASTREKAPLGVAKKPAVKNDGGLLCVGTPYAIPPETPLRTRAPVDLSAPHQFAPPPPHTRIRSGNSVSAPALPWLAEAAGGSFWPFSGLHSLLPCVSLPMLAIRVKTRRGAGKSNCASGAFTICRAGGGCRVGRRFHSRATGRRNPRRGLRIRRMGAGKSGARTHRPEPLPAAAVWPHGRAFSSAGVPPSSVFQAPSGLGPSR